jgi:hypothetical protein
MLGTVVAVLVAVSITFLAADAGWSWRLDLGFVGADWDGWPLLSVAVVVAAWANVFAWVRRIWPLAIVCSLLVFVAPWGFLYPGILAGPILAIAAGVAWARTKKPVISSSAHA